MEYLKSLLERVDRISLEGRNPPLARGPEDKFVGTLPKSLRKLWVAMADAMDKLEEVNREGRERFGELDDAMLTVQKHDMKELYQQYVMANSEAKLLSECFWASLRHAFPKIASEQLIGVRAGWLVVKVNTIKRTKQLLAEFLDQICQAEERTDGDGDEDEDE